MKIIATIALLFSACVESPYYQERCQRRCAVDAMTVGVDDEHGLCRCVRPIPPNEWQEWTIPYFDVPPPPKGTLVTNRN